MAERMTLSAASRIVLGKKVRRLRREGLLPANVYGRGLDSTAIQLDGRDFRRAIRQVGIRSMFELAIEGEKEPRHSRQAHEVCERRHRDGDGENDDEVSKNGQLVHG